MKTHLVSGILLLASLIAGTESAYAVQQKPPTSTSWYVAATSGSETNTSLYNWMYNKGYAAGQSDLSTPGTQYNVVIFAFGQPQSQSGVYGASGYGRFLSVSVIKEAARQFARGYWYGSGSDTASQMRMVLGTNNSGTNGYTDQFLYSHGGAWIQLVKDAATAIQSYASQVSVRGGNDIEVGYSTPAKAYSWVNGYANGFASPYWMYDFGDAQGCPQSGTSRTPGNCDNGWTQDDIEYVSWAAVAYPFPQIYSTAGGNAKQWQQITLYSYLAYDYGSINMDILGPLSQSTACVQAPPCSGTNNTPQQAWDQLWTELNNDSRTAQSISYSSDIKWRYKNGVLY